MTSKNTQVTARRYFDSRLDDNTLVQTLQRPPRGWVKAIRKALGMTTGQLARRLGITQPAVVLLERSKSLGHIRLDTLQGGATALDCRVVYALVPNKPLEQQAQTRRREIAEQRLAAVEHSMALKNQSVEDRETRRDLLQERFLKDLHKRMLGNVWT